MFVSAILAMSMAKARDANPSQGFSSSTRSGAGAPGGVGLMWESINQPGNAVYGNSAPAPRVLRERNHLARDWRGAGEDRKLKCRISDRSATAATAEQQPGGGGDAD